MMRLLIVAAAAGLSGCMSLAPVASLPALSSPTRCRPEEVAALPEGARVELTYEDSDQGLITDTVTSSRRVGTVLKASPEGVALANCVVEHRSSLGNPVLTRTPYVKRLFRNTGVGMDSIPVVWIPTAQIGTARVLEAPPAGYVPPSIEIDTKSRDVVERIGVDFDHVTGTPSGTFVVEQFDTETGEVLRSQRVAVEWDSSSDIPDADMRYLPVDSSDSEESPGVQSLGRRTSGHGPATPDPGTARID